MVKFLFGLVFVLVVVTLVPVTFLGLVPGLSKLVGAGPKDLGIKILKEDSLAVFSKTGVEIVAMPKNTTPDQDFVLEGTKEADLTFSSKELTALTNNRSWKNFPVKEVQIKIDKDGAIECSGILVISKVLPYAMALGYSEEEIADVLKKYRIPQLEAPFYIKGTGSAEQNAVKIEATSVQIGAVPLPDKLVAQANREAESLLNSLILKNSQSFFAEIVAFSNDAMRFKGRLPEKEYVVTE